GVVTVHGYWQTKGVVRTRSIRVPKNPWDELPWPGGKGEIYRGGISCVGVLFEFASRKSQGHRDCVLTTATGWCLIFSGDSYYTKWRCFHAPLSQTKGFPRRRGNFKLLLAN